MTTGMNFWDTEVWSLVVTLGILLISMMVANTLRNLIKPLRRAMIPSAVLGGFLLLAANAIYKAITGSPMVQSSVLEVLTYHGLGLGFAAMALRNMEKKKEGRSKTGAFDTGVSVVNSYLLQAILGLLVTVGLYYLIGSFFASGLLLPMGYGQGPGQAYNWGHTYEVTYGFTNGTSFGLTVAAMGFVSASVGGVIWLNVLRRRGVISGEIGEAGAVDGEDVVYTRGDEIPLSESMDKFTVQMALVFGAYCIAFLFMTIFNKLINAGIFGGLGETLRGLVWGFQFLFSTLGALLLKSILRALKKKNIIRREYTNNFMQNRIAGFMFDIMVVASIAAIDLSAFRQPSFVLPLALITVLGAVGTFLYLRVVSRRVFPMYENEAFLSLYGMLTGTASTGTILLREVDPRFETQAADNLVYQQLWAILFGFPMLLLLGVAPVSIGRTWLTLGLLAVLFIAFNIILFRKTIFKKKDRKKKS